MAALSDEQKTALATLSSLNYIKARKSFLSIDADVKRAIMRFQRHAARCYRMPQDTADVFHGRVTGLLDADTVAEIKKWEQNGWKLPLGRFPLVRLSEDPAARLRSDAAAAWSALVAKAAAAGGTLAGPYGDTTRAFDFKAGTGASRHSFHYAGRAVDISQPLAGGRNQRYYVAQDPQGADMYWRIWCKVDANKGTAVKAKEHTYYDFYAGKEVAMPAASYIDLTELIEAGGNFERIKAQTGWKENSKKLEWWHFQYCIDKQATIQDELELIGISEAQLLRAGWLIKDLDHAPG